MLLSLAQDERFIRMFIIFINVVLSIIIIFLERKQPTSVYAWLLFIWIVPVVGFIFYILFSQKFSSNKVYRFRKTDNRRSNSELDMQKRELTVSPLQAYYNFGEYKDNIEYHVNVSEALYTDDNSVTVYNDGHEFFEELIQEMEKAKSSINLEFYIINNDNLGNRVFDVLEKKAKEGVEVRVIYDEVGSNTIGRKNIKRLQEAGGKIGAFLPSRLSSISKYMTIRINYRDHRKVAVIDGKVGFIGGFNVGDEYLGLAKKFGYWRDTALRITGGAVRELQWRFLSDWTTTGVEKINLKDVKQFPHLFAYSDEAPGNVGVQIVASGPDNSNQVIKQGYLKMISDAKHRIRITSPYFVLDDSMEEALKIALNSGVKVEILIPIMPDHPFIYPTTLSYVGTLIEYGAEVYKYQPGFVHAKVMTIDDKLAVVGSCNFDIRSFALNFECSAFIYDHDTTVTLNKMFEEDKKVSEHYSLQEYKNRGTVLKVKESLCRLLSPIL